MTHLVFVRMPNILSHNARFVPFELVQFSLFLVFFPSSFLF